MIWATIKFLFTLPLFIFIALAVIGTVDQFLFGALAPPLTIGVALRATCYVVLGIVYPFVVCSKQWYSAYQLRKVRPS